MKTRVALAVGVLCLVEGTGAQSTRTPALLGILRSELQRNMQVLEQQPVPAYFGAYTVHDTRQTQMYASFGAIDRSDETRQRLATVEVRVGDHDLDNTHPLRGEARAMGPRLLQVSLPLTDEEKPIRQALWRATDRSYKQATEALTRVRSNVAAKVQDENPAPDFSREDQHEHIGSLASYSLDTNAWEGRLRRVSAVFAEDPLILRSSVSLSIEARNRFYSSSEGSQVVTGRVGARVFIQGITKADDGMELPLYTSYFASSTDGLPSESQLMADARSMMELLARLRTAPLVDPFSGPAILSGRAAGVFFHEIFGHRVEGNRQRNVNDAQTFASRVDQPVLPPFLDVVFDPTLKRMAGTELMGHYDYDDQGVKARRVTVVDNGELKTFLLDRAPVRNFRRSNGHGRAELGFLPVSRQSNLVVESSKSVSTEQLMTMLRDEARRQGKPFGLLFDNIEGGFTNTGRGSPNAFNVLPNVVYRVYTDGRAPELVRGVDLIGTPLAAFGKIIATSDKTDVFNGVCGAESGGVPVSASSPALLVSEVEVQKKAQSQETMPILPAPPRTGSPAARTSESAVFAAMQDEMKRSMAELRMKGEEAPYFIAYELLDRTVADVSGRLGAVVENSPRRSRTLRVEVRVGDYSFDSSRFVLQGFGGGIGLSGEIVAAPLDDHYDAMRRELWTATDAAYKRAISTFSRKKAAFQNRAQAESVPDFSRETPNEVFLPPVPPISDADFRDAASRARQASAVFASAPDVDLSDVAVAQVRGTRYYLNSEGFKTIAPIEIAALTITAEAQAADGMPVRETFTAVERSVPELPQPTEVVARAREISGRVGAARTAPVGEDFAGPVLIEGRGSAQLISETLVPMMEARRPPDGENPRMMQSQSSPFINRTGLRVLADAFSVVDTPSLARFEGKPLVGSYTVDDEGVPAKDVTLVSKGRLATLLTGRTPQRNFLRSNGHGRSGTVLAGVFQLESSVAIPSTELKEKYIAMLKAQDKTFGYIVRGVRSDGRPGGGPAIDRIVRVTLDGEEEPVRGLRFGTVTATAFRDVAEASQERSVFSYRAGATSAVSVIAPSLIFEELEIQRSRDLQQKPPLVPSPLKN